MNDQSPSPELIDQVKASEKLCLTPYVDLAGYTTWGWGHKGKPGEQVPQIITEQDALALLDADLHIAGAAVREHVTIDMTQSQFDGLTDFTFNLGAGALAGSTMLRLFNNSDFEGAALECRKWDHAHVRGHLVEERGLKIRREWDATHISPETADKPWSSEGEVRDSGTLVFPPLDEPNAPTAADSSMSALDHKPEVPGTAASEGAA